MSSYTWPGAGGTGTGNVVGPVSSVDGQVALFSGTSGQLLKTQTGLSYTSNALRLPAQLEVGSAAVGQSSVNLIGYFRSDQNTTTIAAIVNNSAGAGGGAVYRMQSSLGILDIAAFSAANTPTARITSDANFTGGFQLIQNGANPINLVNNSKIALTCQSATSAVYCPVSLEVGKDGSGSSNSSTLAAFDSNQNAGTIIAIGNNSSGASAYAGIRVITDNFYSFVESDSSGNGGLSSFGATTGSNGLNISVGGAVPIYLATNGARQATITGAGSVVIGGSALATNATDGFLYVPTCAGAPSGTPTAQSATKAMVYDTTDNKLYVYNGGWKSVTLS